MTREYLPHHLLMGHDELWQKGIDVELSAEAFYDIVVGEFDQLPEALLKHIDNLIVVTEDEPDDGSDSLGYYDGIALTDRDSSYSGYLPDRIVLFRGPLTRMCADLAELRDEIHITLVHELAHFHGFTEEQIHELGWG